MDNRIHKGIDVGMSRGFVRPGDDNYFILFIFIYLTLFFTFFQIKHWISHDNNNNPIKIN